MVIRRNPPLRILPLIRKMYISIHSVLLFDLQILYPNSEYETCLKLIIEQQPVNKVKVSTNFWHVKCNTIGIKVYKFCSINR